jgi:hypothetical protein
MVRLTNMLTLAHLARSIGENDLYPRGTRFGQDGGNVPIVGAVQSLNAIMVSLACCV